MATGLVLIYSPMLLCMALWKQPLGVRILHTTYAQAVALEAARLAPPDCTFKSWKASITALHTLHRPTLMHTSIIRHIPVSAVKVFPHITRLTNEWSPSMPCRMLPLRSFASDKTDGF